MKTNLTKRRYKGQKRSACGLCKPYKRGWEDKKTVRDLRIATKHQQEIEEAQSYPSPARQ
jgi:hypothetical protein